MRRECIWIKKKKNQQPSHWAREIAQRTLLSVWSPEHYQERALSTKLGAPEHHYVASNPHHHPLLKKGKHNAMKHRKEFREAETSLLDSCCSGFWACPG